MWPEARDLVSCPIDGSRRIAEQRREGSDIFGRTSETRTRRMTLAATLTDVHEPMTRRGWLLFAAMSVIWGVPYLLIKVAVRHVEPSVIVFGRTSSASAVLLVAAKSKMSPSREMPSP